jgi:DNA-binding NarL/FixJ family response regulator
MRILIGDERRAVRDHLAGLLVGVAGVESVDSVVTGDLLKAYDGDVSTVLLIGTQRALSGGVEAARMLLSLHPAAVIVVLGSADDLDSLGAAIGCGARAYLRWDSATPEIAATLAYVLADSQRLTLRRAAHTGDPLSERETQVLVGMSRGRSNAQIGRELFLSEDTVKTYARHLYRKLRAADRAQAVAIGIRAGLLT